MCPGVASAFHGLWGEAGAPSDPICSGAQGLWQVRAARCGVGMGRASLQEQGPLQPRSVPRGEVFRPPRRHLEHLEPMDFLGKAKVRGQLLASQAPGAGTRGPSGQRRARGQACAELSGTGRVWCVSRTCPCGWTVGTGLGARSQMGLRDLGPQNQGTEQGPQVLPCLPPLPQLCQPQQPPQSSRAGAAALGGPGCIVPTCVRPAAPPS